ncbi:hypothetical protein N9334_04520 [Luminiphilus sp.]|nr:hypothetical protein [Luminiphilus sp.]MDB3919067.1 hypothetical protein [Luminiphilus sp.]
MIVFGRFSKWFLIVPVAMLAFLIWDVTSRSLAAQQSAEEQFRLGFMADGSRREGMRDLLARDVRTELMYSLHSVSDAQALETDAARFERLDETFERLGFALRHSRYDFFEGYLVESTPSQQLILRGRYPTETSLVGAEVSGTNLLAHVNVSEAELFDQVSTIAQVTSPDDLLLIGTPQPVFIDARLILQGDESLSSWFIVLRVGFADLNRSIDLVGQQMSGGATPLRVINVDKQTEACLTVWEVGVGSLDCDTVTLSDPVQYRSQYKSNGVDDLTYSIFQVSDSYRVARAPSLVQEPVWRRFMPAGLALLLLLTALSYIRYRTQNESLQDSFSRLLSDKDSLNGSIHEVLSTHLDVMSRFTFAMRAEDMPQGNRRYFDLAINEFMQAQLSLNTLILQQPPDNPTASHESPAVDLQEVAELAQMVLDVSTLDSSIETKLFVSEDLPKQIKGFPNSVHTAVIAAIVLSSEGTDDGAIEVSLWAEKVDGKICGFLRITDTGVGWGDMSLDAHSVTTKGQERALGSDGVTRQALLTCLQYSGTSLIKQSETEAGNEYVLQLCSAAPIDD